MLTKGPFMPRKTVIGIVIIAVVALVTYSVGTAIGIQILGGRAEWSAWREANPLYFFLIWIGSVVVISLPVLWIVGTRLEKTMGAQERDVAAAKGVGRFAMKALQGNVDATDKLFDLLDDPVLAVRCQAARALAIIDKREIDKELFRQVRYWQGNDKLALINTLKTTHDFRARRLMELLANDRNPVVVRRARASMFAVTPRTSRVDNIADSVKKGRKTSQGTVGLGEQMSGQRRSSSVKPSAGDQVAIARQARAGSAAGGADQAKPKKRGRPSLPSMAPGERAARAAARQEAALGKRAARAAVAADNQPPLRKKSDDVAPRKPSAKPAPRKASATRPAGASGAARPAASASGVPRKRPPADGQPSSAAKPAAKSTSPRPKPAAPRPKPIDPQAPPTDPPADAAASGPSAEES
jgi:hypothetical protein